MTTVIGYNTELGEGNITLFFRNNEGWKFRVITWNATGAKDLYMCSDIPKMSFDEYNKLPDKQIKELTAQI